MSMLRGAAGHGGRFMHIGMAMAVGMFIIGFLSGTRDPGPGTRAGPRASGAASAAVPRYADMGSQRRGPNADMYEGALAPLREGLPKIDEPVIQDASARLAAVAARAQRRAFDGAPPVIPHEIDQLGRPDCLACHQQGLVIAGRIAPAISHPPYASCTQCHVVARDPRGLGEVPPPANGFVGLASSGPGARAWPEAPPTMPHSMWMRSECASCHGVTGRPGIRTTHPQRQSCLQCHAPSAVLDQRNPVPGGPGGPGGKGTSP